MAAEFKVDAERFAQYPQNVGIVAMDAYFPRKFVAQKDLESHDKVDAGKYTVGLGQANLAFVDDREDIYSICLTVVANTMEKFGLSYKDIGRLEVATETISDHSKAVKTYLMQLFAESGNTDIEGVDSMNACYAGTHAFFNSLDWIESSSWDGRFAMFVAADIAEYAPGPARPTGGCGALCVVVGPNAPLVVERGVRSSHMEHAYDFFKPHMDSPYPVVDGKFSNICYLRALDTCYQRFVRKYKAVHGKDILLSDFDYAAFHAPYNKLVQKSWGRLFYNDFLVRGDAEEYKDLQKFKEVSVDASYNDRELEQSFGKISKATYASKVVPSTLLPRELGNMYTASLYAGLLSLIYTEADKLAGKRILMFSYGSGLASSMFSIVVGDSDAAKAALEQIRNNSGIAKRLEERINASAETFNKVMALRETLHSTRGFEPSGSVDELYVGTFFLSKKDDMGRRFYLRSKSE